MSQFILFDSLLEPVFVLNKSGEIVYCNESASTLCNLPARKIVRNKMLLAQVITFETPIEYFTDISSITEVMPYRETKIVNSAGDEGKVQITLQPFQNGENDDPLWIAFTRDVTLEERLQKKYRAELEQKEEFIRHLEDAQKQLKQYSEKLELMVAERTAELVRLNKLMATLLDSLNQGFFVFDISGKVLDFSSKACLEVLENNPQGQLIWDVLKLPSNKVEGFQKWLTTLFSEMLPFEDLAPLGPESYPHSQGNKIKLEYYPLRSENTIEGVVVVASDITSLVEAQEQAEYEKNHANLIIKMIRNKFEITRFINETKSILADLSHSLSTNIQNNQNYDSESTFRFLHTLKGGASTFSLSTMAKIAHEAESLVSENVNATAIRDKVMSIETAFHQFLNEAQEIMGPQILNSDRRIEVPASQLKKWARTATVIPATNNIANEIYSEFIEEPFEGFFVSYKDLSMRIAEQVSKPAPEISIFSNDIKLNPEVYNPLFTTFVHAFRNSLDHGIEFAEIRESKGKPAQGRITVSCDKVNSNSELLICFSDDGNGIDPQKIRDKLQAKGTSTHAETDSQVIQHIFDSQFSTKDAVSDISGRGVGMDAIRHAAEILGGKVWVESLLGRGMSIFIEVPYLKELDSLELLKIKRAS